MMATLLLAHDLGGGVLWEPMAIAIMAGLVWSTAVSLVLVPILYASFMRVDVGVRPA